MRFAEVFSSLSYVVREQQLVTIKTETVKLLPFFLISIEAQLGSVFRRYACEEKWAGESSPKEMEISQSGLVRKTISEKMAKNHRRKFVHTLIMITIEAIARNGGTAETAGKRMVVFV